MKSNQIVIQNINEAISKINDFELKKLNKHHANYDTSLLDKSVQHLQKAKNILRN